MVMLSVLKVILVRPASIQMKSAGTNWPNHHENKTIEPLAFIEPANVLVVGFLTDHSWTNLGPYILARWKIMAQPIHDADVIVDSPDNMTVDENTCYRCQGAWNNRDHCLKDLKKDKERWTKDACLENKLTRFLWIEGCQKSRPRCRMQGLRRPQ